MARQHFHADVIQRWTDAQSRLLWFSTDPAAPPQVCLLMRCWRARVRTAAPSDAARERSRRDG